jgi:HAMP domain-containing protein
MSRTSAEGTPPAGQAPAAAEGRRRLRPRFGSSLSWRLAVLIISLLAVSAVVTALYAASTVRGNAEANNRESMANVHRSVGQTLEQAASDVQRFEETALANRKALVRDLTDAQLQAMDQLNAAVGRGSLSLAAAQVIAGQMLFDFRYGAGDYFFAFTPEMVSIVEPNPTFRGDMIDYRDANGKAFFREFQQVALGPGSGYVDYVGTRVGAAEPSPKVSYVALFEPWDWVVGTGVYLDDIEAEAASRLAEAEAGLSAVLDGVSFAGAGFFFVLDGEGAVLAGPDDHDVDALQRTDWGRELAATLIGVGVDAGNDVAPLVVDAQFDGEDTGWRFGVSRIPSEDWVLVSAVPLAELTRSANALALRQVLLSAVVLCIGLAIGLLTSRRIVRPVQDLTAAARALEDDRFDPGALDKAAARRDEMGALARAFRRMAAEVVERERALRDRVSRLEVVIDRHKVNDEISAITESDFFRNLERQAEELRKGSVKETEPDTGVEGGAEGRRQGESEARWR